MLKQILALLLSVAMVFSMIPVQAFAAAGEAAQVQIQETESVAETTVPTETVTEPAEETTAPVEAAAEVAEETTAPTEPAEETTAPTEAVAGPVEETTAPTETVTEPTEETTAPTESATEPTQETTVPTEAVTEPTEETVADTEDAMEDQKITTNLGTASDAAVYAVATSGTCGENLTWSWDQDNSLLTISGTGPMEDYETYGSPWDDISSTYKVTVVIEDGVTTVGNNAFYNAGWVDQVSLPETLVSIGEYAFFRCTDLTTITLPSNLTVISKRAFCDCAGLTTISFSTSLTEIGDSAFSGCSALTTASLPAGLTTIGEYAFSSCTALTTISIPDSVTSIGQSAFSHCSALTTVNIPESITTLNNDLFWACTGLTEITIPDSVTTINSAFGGCENLQEITIPSSVTTLDGSFTGCSGLTEIIIPDSVTVIGSGTFAGCTGLTTITVPDSVTNIGSGTFSGCENLTEIVLPDSGNLKKIEDNAFANCTSLKECVIPDSVYHLGRHAFEGCTGLEKVVLGNLVDFVLDNTFENCTSLKNVTLSERTFDIMGCAFSGCTALEYIVLPEGLTSIGWRAFYGCTSLKEINIPDSVTGILGESFYGCTSLTSVHIPKNVNYFGDGNFAYCDNLTSFTVDEENTFFSAADGVIYSDNSTKLVWCPPGMKGVITIPEGITTIPGHIFAKCSGITKIILPESVTSIGAGAFAGCSGLKEISLPEGITFIGANTFEGCSSLAAITIPSGVTSIGDCAFTGCSSLTEVDIPDSVTSIGAGAFSKCNSLKAAAIPKSVTSVGNNVFSGYLSLTDIYFDGTKDEWDSRWNNNYYHDQSDWIDQVTVHCRHMQVYSNKPNLSVQPGKTITLSAGIIVKQERVEDISGITFQIADTSILELVDTDTKDNCRYVELKALALGTTTVTFSDSNSGCMAVVAVTVCEPQKNTYTLSSVPERDIDGVTNNFKGFNGLYIDSFSYSQDETGKATVSFDAYNSNNSYGIVEVFDENGDFYNFVLINKTKEYSTSLKEAVWDNGGIFVEDLVDGDLFCYRMELGYNKHTPISIQIPKNGYITITIDPEVSDIAHLVNYVDIVFSMAEALGDVDDYRENSMPFLHKIVEDAQAKGLKNLVKSTIKESVIDSTTIGDFISEICTNLSVSDFESIIVDSAAECGFGIAEGLLDYVPSLGTAFEIIFAVGKGANVLHQAISLRDSHDTGAIIIQNQTESSRTYEKVTVKSETDFPDDVALNVFEVTLDDGVLGELKETMPEIHEALTQGTTYTYNISLLNNKQEVQPESKVTVYIPIPDELKALAYLGQTNVYRVEEDGTVTDMQATIQDGCFVFSTDHFSLYILSGYDAGETPENVVASGSCGDALTWMLDNSGVLTISGNGGMTEFAVDYSDIPWYAYRDQITTIRMESGVTTISQYAFVGCTNAAEIILPETLTDIGYYSFWECSSLEEINIPAGVTSIEPTAFSGCSSLQGIWVDESNPVFTSDEAGVLFNEDMTELLKAPGMLMSYNVPETVTEIGLTAFEGCSSLNSIRIPASVSQIGRNAFFKCSSLETVYISDLAAWCGIAFSDDNSNPATFAKALYLNEELITNLEIPSGVTAISDYAFSQIQSITSVTIPDTVTSIGQNAFSRCTKLISVDMSENVTQIGTFAFWGCEALTAVEIPDGVETVAYEAFAHCYALETVTIGKVTSFEDGVFWECSQINEITFTSDAPVFGENMFYDVTAKAYYPANHSTWTEDVMQDYGGTITWVAYEQEEAAIIASGTCGDNLTWTLDENGLLTISGSGEMTDFSVSGAPWDAYRSDIQSVKIDNGASGIGNYAFYYCDSLSSITIPDSVTRIGKGAFMYTGQLDMIIPDSVTSIGVNTFQSSGVNSVVLSKNLTSIPDDMFHWSDLKSIEIPDGITEIGTCAFAVCKSLTSVTMADSVTSIHDYAFSDCSKLTDIALSDNVTTLGIAAFAGCSALTHFTIPDSMTAIPERTFEYCTSLTEIVIPNSVVSIGDNAFFICRELPEITIPENVSSIGYGVFWDCSALKVINFMGDAPQIDGTAFANVAATAHYHLDNSTWTDDKKQDYGGYLTWIPYGAVENRVALNSAELAEYTSVWIDGVEYALQTDGSSCYVDLPDGSAKTLVAYTYHVGDASDLHTQYPTGMKVWTLDSEGGFYTATRQEELDNILQYAGSSIRVTGKQGIRMITAIEQTKKEDLTSGGLAGYTLKEYGTVVAWTSQMGDNPLVLGESYAKSNYAYKKGVADPVLGYDGDLMQYTNVLVGFRLDTCKNDIAMRPYMILQDMEGNEISLYGGIVTRSIGYIAYQNRNAFASGTKAYEYVWKIIHSVYDDVYDAEYVA